MMQDDDLLIRRWLESPEEVHHELYFVGPRLLSRTETVAVRYPVMNEQIVVCSDRLLMAQRDHFPRSIRMFILKHNDAYKLFNFFDVEHAIKHGSRSESREPEAVKNALEILFEHRIPEPARLRRAARADILSGAMGYHAALILAFRDLLIPERFRYAMPLQTTKLPRSLSGGTFVTNNFIVFDNMDDAVAAKMVSDQTIIIDLDGEDDIAPPPAPEFEPDIPF
jgi:hypothetical protein